MSFRTVVRDGLIVINTHGEIPDGTPVEIPRPVDRTTAKKRRGHAQVKGAAKPRAKRSAKKSGALDKLIGIWKDRPDWKGKSTLEVVEELREKAMGRKRRG